VLQADKPEDPPTGSSPKVWANLPIPREHYEVTTEGSVDLGNHVKALRAGRRVAVGPGTGRVTGHDLSNRYPGRVVEVVLVRDLILLGHAAGPGEDGARGGTMEGGWNLVAAELDGEGCWCADRVSGVGLDEELDIERSDHIS